VPLSFTFGVSDPVCNPTYTLSISDLFNASTGVPIFVTATTTSLDFVATSDVTLIGSHALTVTITPLVSVLTPPAPITLNVVFICTVTVTAPLMNDVFYETFGAGHLTPMSVPVPAFTFNPACPTSYTWILDTPPMFITNDAANILINTADPADVADHTVFIQIDA
jgi:hypothetical protein